jgi:hypothetical protein
LIEEKITAAVGFLSRVLAGEARKLMDAGKDPGTVRVIAKKTQDNTFAMVGRQLLAAMEKHVHADKRAFGHVQKESPPAAVHSKIVNELESARHEFIATRDTNEASRGYMGFALADETLLECVAAIEQLTDRAQIVDMLKARLPLAAADGWARSSSRRTHTWHARGFVEATRPGRPEREEVRIRVEYEMDQLAKQPPINGLLRP